ncbi:HNH endonuclease [Loktanella sp. IMCC34160]|nr:HNH endonuclease [Loktanella sp. IMCC34160]
MHQTEKALIARGVDSATAQKLRVDGWTISKLKTSSKDELKAAGLSDVFITKLYQEQRPPIPDNTLSKLLFDNRFQCCICRDPELPIIVHHIDEWARSRSHAPDNLAVLCLKHHSDAHSKKDLAQNLDPKTLTEFNVRWEREVKLFDSESILQAMRLEYSNWNYVNELRVFEIALSQGIKTTEVKHFRQLVAMGVAQKNGLPTPIKNDGLFYMYQGELGMQRYFFVTQVLHEVIKIIPIINISDYLDKGTLGPGLAPGDFIFVQGKQIFSPLTEKKNGTGRGQICLGSRSVNGVTIEFVFDRWEATSSSSKAIWLTGTQNQGSLIHVKSLTREKGHFVISGTVLGICSNNGDLKKRDYAHTLFKSGHFRNPYAHYEEDDVENWGDETDLV